jgi:hypothetical protein
MRRRSVEPLAKFPWDCKKRQGTTLVVPEDRQKMMGFSPFVFYFHLFAIPQWLKTDSKWGRWRHD